MVNIDQIMNLAQKPILALVIFFMGFVIGKIIGSFVAKISKQFNLDEYLKKMSPRLSFKRYGEVVSYIIYIISVYFALEVLNITKIVIILILIVLAMISVIWFTLNLRDFFPNIIAGHNIRKEKKIMFGKNIRTILFRGKVIRVGLLETHIKSDNENIYIQNRSLTSDVIVK